ncbi:MFS transporter [Salidesulfovibrio brasiliensis]|uniref:MFS transporter n=1 Tax=Salidesulfovibrio brasiliensis TaxID=221711 RepID=UPI0006D0347D|nr:MFS transporter [Salidesulfovibrio brasiliensis]
MPRTDKRSVLFAITATQFAVPYMVSGVAVALPVIGRELGASAVDLSLVESSYIAAVAMLLLPAGRLCDMFGGGLIFSIGLALYQVITFALGFVHDMEHFVLLRLLQGFAGSMMISPGMALLTEAYPRGERGKAIGISITGVYLGISAGPFLGGIITTTFGWRWLLFTGVIPCLAALWMAVRGLPLTFRRRVEGGFDWLGSILSASGIGLAVFGSSTFDEPHGMHFLWAGLATLIAFLLWERLCAHPLLDLRLFRGNRPFSFGCLVQYINYTATFGVTFLLSVFLQYGKGMTAQEAGTVLVIQPLTMAVFSPLAGRLSDTMDSHKLAGTGMFVSVVGVALASMIGLETSMWHIVAVLLCVGLGTAFFSTPNMSSIMGSVGARHLGVASAMTAVMRTVGMTSGMILITVVMARLLGDAAVTEENITLYMQALRTSLMTFTAIGIPGIMLTFMAVSRKETA